MVEGVVRNGVGMKMEAQIEVGMEKNMNKGGGLGGVGDGGGGLAAAENIKKGGAVGVGGGGDASSVVRWERFLPKMVLRVLLVEADDSTRQIITALLRKCSYRVAAVSDGLKAWEVLKRRPHNVDLILTEVDLSSISGFALLTLIMEHEICKNIPVIMMSSKDSVSTVYKCMLRGATDFLMKPVRKNELRNLWQHVWRKQVVSLIVVLPFQLVAGLGLQMRMLQKRSLKPLLKIMLLAILQGVIWLALIEIENASRKRVMLRALVQSRRWILKKQI